MELESMRFYRTAAKRTTNLSVRKLLDELAVAEQVHEDLAGKLNGELEESGARKAEDQTHRRMFVLQVIQPGLAGLMDGSVSTLAPVFAAAFATRDSWDAFRSAWRLPSEPVLAWVLQKHFPTTVSSVGADARHSGGSLRTHATMGGVGHTLPFSITNFHVAMLVAVVVVGLELAAISWIRHKYMDTPLLAQPSRWLSAESWSF